MKKSMLRLTAVLLIITLLCISVCGCRHRSKPLQPNIIDRLYVWTSAGDPLKDESYLSYSHTDGNEEQELEFIKNYVHYISKIDNREGDKNKRAFEIDLYYTDENGAEKSAYATGDSFPEGWADFIRKCNRLSRKCRMPEERKIITTSTEKQVLTPELLTKLTGYTDDDLTEGTLQDMIDKLELSLNELTGSFGGYDSDDMVSLCDRYYYKLHEKELEPYLGDNKKTIEKDSTEAEFVKFVNSYLRKTRGAALGEIKDNAVVQVDLEKSGYCYIMQTKKMTSRGVKKDGDRYELVLDAGECGLQYCTSFYYSKDFKYIISKPESVYDLLLFIK